MVYILPQSCDNEFHRLVICWNKKYFLSFVLKLLLINIYYVLRPLFRQILSPKVAHISLIKKP